MGEPYIRRGIPFMEELPTLRTIGQVYHRDRYVRDLLIPIDSFIDQGIREGCDDEDNHHSRVTEDTSEFRDEGLYYLKFEV